jgi:hypothetical protein
MEKGDKLFTVMGVVGSACSTAGLRLARERLHNSIMINVKTLQGRHLCRVSL